MALVGLPYLVQRTAVESINAHLERTFLHRLTYSLSVQLVLADGESPRRHGPLEPSRNSLGTF